MRRTLSCRHGMAVGIIRCVVCNPRPGDSADFPAKPDRSPPRFRLVVGATVAGAKVVELVGEQRVVAVCGCGKNYEIGRSAIGKHFLKGTRSMCRGCQADAVKRLVEAKREMRA